MRTISTELLRTLSRYPKWPSTATELVRIVGWEGAARLISEWRGQEWPVPIREGGATPAGIRRYAQLEELIGGAAALRVVQHWRGQRLYVPSLKEVLSDWIADQIRTEFDELTGAKGYTSPEAVFELGLKYDVTGRWVEMLLSSPCPELSDLMVEETAQWRLF